MEALILHSLALQDRKSTRLNSSHSQISYAVFCLKKQFFLFQPVFDQLPLNGLAAAQLVWASVVGVALLGFHFVIASRDRAAVGEEGASATLRRWYMYVALLVGLLTMLSSAAYLLQLGWTKLVLGSIDTYLYMATPAGLVIAGSLRWSFHARAGAWNHISRYPHS